MQKRYYYDKKSGIILFVCLTVLILPLAVILIIVSLAVCLLGLAAFIYEDINIAFRLFLILLILCPLPIIWGSVGFIKLCGKRAFLYLRYIEIDGKGITSKYSSKAQKHWCWDEIAECGVGWEINRLPRDNKPLPEGEEKFVLDMFKYRHINGIKYIFFSTKEISLSEKMEIFYGQQKKDYLIAVRYTQELAEYLHSIGRFGRKKRVVREQTRDKGLDNAHLRPNEKIKFKQFADKKTGFEDLFTFFGFLYITVMFSSAFIISINQRGNSHGISIWIIILLVLVIGIIFVIVFVYGLHIMDCLRMISVDNKGVKSKFFFGKEKRWSWEEIKECGVIRDNSGRNKGFREIRVSRDERYIFFSLSPLCLEKDKRLISQFKRKDVIFLLYSDELYCYLKALGVMEESKN